MKRIFFFFFLKNSPYCLLNHKVLPSGNLFIFTVCPLFLIFKKTLSLTSLVIFQGVYSSFRAFKWFYLGSLITLSEHLKILLKIVKETISDLQYKQN